MSNQFSLGNVLVTPIPDLDSFDIPIEVIFPASSQDAVDEHRDWLEPAHYFDGKVRLAVRSWLLQDGDTNILIDTCVGNHKDRPNRLEWHLKTDANWITALSSAGLSPEDIHVVLCTHLHADHVGWNTRLLDGRWVPTFPNARYIVSETEFRHWQTMVDQSTDPSVVGHGCFQDSVLPVVEAGQMDLVRNGWELAKGLVLDSSAGHTPGHVSLNVNRSGASATFCGDAVHSPVQIVEPDLSSAFCTDPERARSTRWSLFEKLADTSTLLIPAHFQGTGRCRIVSNGERFLPEF